MKKFILISFGFLGWAFYVMSGGADFEAASDRHARLNPAPAVTVIDNAVIDNAVTDNIEVAQAETDPATTEAEVSRVSLNLTSLQNALDADHNPDAETSDTQIVVVDEYVVPITDPTLTDSASTPAIIPSLIAPEDGGLVQNASLVTSGAQDVREVTGNRVNVRGGPGTNHNIVSKLVRGDAVEILQDNGDGWVKMRPLSGGAEGWMADFLLTSG